MLYTKVIRTELYLKKIMDNNIDIEKAWPFVEKVVQDRFGKSSTDLKTILFLLGLRDLGKAQGKFTKEEKQDLMNLAICRVFSLSGYFIQEGVDEDGWPIWKQNKALPKMNVKEQELFIKTHVTKYFMQEELI